MRRSALYGWIWLAILTLLASCKDEDVDQNIDPENQIIVEGYVFANEPVDHIKISKVHQEGEASLIPVNDAQVRISQGSTTVALVLDSNGVYKSADPSVLFSGNAPLILEAIVNGITYTSETKFPPPISNLQITTDMIDLFNAPEDEVIATLSWAPAPGAGAYALFVKEENTDSIYENPDWETSSGSPLFSIHSQHSLDLLPSHFTHLGTYHLYVTAVNDEYIAMYGDDTDTDLRDGPSNINGGWGVFTAFNGMSVEVTVE
jgi:hypothetical protein